MSRPPCCPRRVFTDVTSFDPFLPPCTAGRVPVLPLVWGKWRSVWGDIPPNKLVLVEIVRYARGQG